MSTALIDRLNEERASLVAFVEQTVANVENRDLSDTEVRSINDTKARIEAIDGQLRPLVDFMATRSAAADMSNVLGKAGKREQSRVEERSIGEAFAASDAFAQYRGMGTSARFVTEARALPIGTADVGSNKVKPRIDATLPTSTPLLDAIPTINVSANGIEVVVWTKKTGGAAVVAEKSAKPAVEFGPTVTPKTLQTIAGYTQLTRQLMEDEPAVASAINGLLMRDVVLKAEAEAAAALVAATLPTAEGETLLKAIRVGVGTVQAAGYNPNAVILNPADWAELDIELFSGTLNGAVLGQRFWGLAPIASAAQPEGTATVGDLTAGVQRYQRTGTSLYITDSHADTFLSNVFTVLAEQRALTVVTRPDALVECAAAAA